MNPVLRTAAVAAALVLAAAGQAQAADLQSASFVDEATAGGDYYLDGNALGAVFHFSTAVKVDSIGGNFTAYGDGNAIYGALVSLSGLSSLATSAIAHVEFTPVGGDQTVALAGVQVAAGDYAVVFGSGLWGTQGSSGLVAAQEAAGSSAAFVKFVGVDATGAASDFTQDTLRVTASVTPVPEAASAWMMVAGLAALAGFARQRARRA